MVAPGTGVSTAITISGWTKVAERNYNAGDVERTISLWERAGTGGNLSATIATPGGVTYPEMGWAWVEWSDVASLRNPTTAIGAGAAPAVTLPAFANANNATLEIIGCAGQLTPAAGAGFTTLAAISGPFYGDNLLVAWRANNDTSVDGGGTGSDYWGIIGVELVVP